MFDTIAGAMRETSDELDDLMPFPVQLLGCDIQCENGKAGPIVSSWAKLLTNGVLDLEGRKEHILVLSNFHS